MVAERVAQEYVQAQVWEEQTKVSNVERSRLVRAGGAVAGLGDFEEVKSSRRRVRH